MSIVADTVVIDVAVGVVSVSVVPVSVVTDVALIVFVVFVTVNVVDFELVVCVTDCVDMVVDVCVVTVEDVVSTVSVTVGHGILSGRLTNASYVLSIKADTSAQFPVINTPSFPEICLYCVLSFSSS